MLEEIAHDGAHADILTDAGNADLEAADAAHNEFNPDAGGTCFVEGCHDIGIAQGIHLGADHALLASEHMINAYDNMVKNGLYDIYKDEE